MNFTSLGGDTCLVVEIIPPASDGYLHCIFEYIDSVTILHPCVRCKSYSCILYDSGDMLKRKERYIVVGRGGLALIPQQLIQSLLFDS